MAGVDGIKSRDNKDSSEKSDSIFVDFKNENSDFLFNEEQIFNEHERPLVGLTEKQNFFSFIIEKYRPKKHHRSIVAGILVLAFFFISFAKIGSAKADAEKLSKKTKEHIEQSYEYIKEGDVKNSIKEADLAGENIAKLKLLAQSWGQDISYFKSSPVANSKLVDMERFLSVAYETTQAINSLNEAIANFGAQGVNAKKNDKDQLFDFSGTELVTNLISENKKRLVQIRKDLSYFENNKTKDYEEIFYKVSPALDQVSESLDVAELILTKDIAWLSGKDGAEKNMLVLFQNNSELRGSTGGSLGSFGIAKFKDDKLLNIDFGQNIYKIDQNFESTHHIKPPEIINFIRENRSWTLKDSGWAIDGPEAFKNIEWFYQEETGQKVDGVITIDTTAILALLDVIGPIEMPSYNKTITSQNFRDELESEVHKDYFQREGGKEENEPKKIIGDMMPLFIDKVFSAMNDDKSTAILSSIIKSLKNKDIMFYFNDNDFQSRIEKLNYGGKVNPSLGDYLYINNSNIDGAKSSLNVEERVSLESKINKDGTVLNSLKIKRSHMGDGQWPDGLNKNFIRIAVPQKSEIVEFKPQEGYFEPMFDRGLRNNEFFWQDEEANKSILSFWLSTKPQEKSSVFIKYKPNYKINIQDEFIYVIDLQKQPGANPDNIELTVYYPSGFAPVNVKNYDDKNNTIRLNFILDKDKNIQIKFKKKTEN